MHLAGGRGEAQNAACCLGWGVLINGRLIDGAAAAHWHRCPIALPSRARKRFHVILRCIDADLKRFERICGVYLSGVHLMLIQELVRL